MCFCRPYEKDAPHGCFKEQMCLSTNNVQTSQDAWNQGLHEVGRWVGDLRMLKWKVGEQQWSKGIPSECTVHNGVTNGTKHNSNLRIVLRLICIYTSLHTWSEVRSVLKLKSLTAESQRFRICLSSFFTCSLTFWIHKCRSRFCQLGGISC